MKQNPSKENSEESKSSKPPQTSKLVNESTLLPWIETGRSQQYDCGWFSVERHDRKSKLSKVEHDYYLVHTKDWVNVVPITTDGRIVFVRQYRQAAEKFGLEVPAGIIEENEEPINAGKRELIEETGYGKGNWQHLGSFYSNPALIKNQVHAFLATPVEIVSKPMPERQEEIEVVILDWLGVNQAIIAGEINNSITIAVLYLARQSLQL